MKIEKIVKVLNANNMELILEGTDLVLLGHHQHFNASGARKVTYADIQYTAIQLYSKKSRKYYEN